MRSIKKLGLLIAGAAVVIAVAAPAVASAAKLHYSPTYEKGGPVPVNQKFTLKSTNFSIMWPGAWSMCQEATIPGRVTSNWAETASGKGDGLGSGKFCSYNGDIYTTNIELTDLQFTGKQSGSISLKVAQQRPWGWCELEGAMPMTFSPGTSNIQLYGTFEKEKGCLGGKKILASFTVATNPFSIPIIIN